MTPYFIKRIALLHFCFLTIFSFGQTISHEPQKFEPNKLRSDFLLLKDTLQKIHPGFYRYKSKTTINTIFDSCLEAINDSMTITDFYALTSFAIASIEDGHTNCRLPKQALLDFIKNEKIFPALVMFIHNRAFIFCCNQNNELKGAELLAIDNDKMANITKRLFNYIPSDGSIQSRKNWELPDNFPILYNIVYGNKTQFNITYKTAKGDIKTTILQADFIKNIMCGNPFAKPNKYLQLQYQKDNTAVLTIKTFFDNYLEQSGENFKMFLDSAFTDINNKRVKKLLIDMRGNQGGNDGNGILLYSHLTEKSFVYYASQNTVNETFDESDHPNLGLKQPNRNNFKGKVYFLVDGRSFSATAEISAVAKSNNRGLFFGEETGGGYYGNTSGDEATVVLTNTQISCRIPMVKYAMAVKKTTYKDRGVIPDFLIYPSISEIMNNKDDQLYKVLKLIASH